jgi:hypothetical protein
MMLGELSDFSENVGLSNILRYWEITAIFCAFCEFSYINFFILTINSKTVKNIFPTF